MKETPAKLHAVPDFVQDDRDESPDAQAPTPIFDSATMESRELDHLIEVLGHRCDVLLASCDPDSSPADSMRILAILNNPEYRLHS